MSIIVQALLASREESRWVPYMMGTGHEPFRPEQGQAKEQGILEVAAVDFSVDLFDSESTGG